MHEQSGRFVSKINNFGDIGLILATDSKKKRTIYGFKLEYVVTMPAIG